MDHDMSMFFHWSTELDFFLFSLWKVDTIGMYILTLLFTLFLALFNQLLFWMLVQRPPKNITTTAKAVFYGLKIIVFTMQIVASYILMLVLMTYNIGICLVLLAGCSIGYTTFSVVAQAITESVLGALQERRDAKQGGLSFRYKRLQTVDELEDFSTD